MGKIALIVISDTDERARLEQELDTPDDQWIIKYSASELESLGIIGNNKIDVVIADLELTTSSGYELLDKIRASHPSVVRILMSDFPEDENPLRFLKLVHQYLPPPVNSARLDTALQRAFLVRSMLEKSALQDILYEFSCLPPMPSLYLSLVDATANDAPLPQIGGIVSGDTAISTRILEIVNSSLFSLPMTIKSPSHAVSLLGIDMIKALVLSLEVASGFEATAFPGDFTIDGLMEHGMATGAVAREIVKAEGAPRKTSDMAMAAGLLHDQGKMILAENFDDRYGEALRVAVEKDESIHEAENWSFKVSHAEIGAYVLGMWGMPKTLVEAIHYHHEPAAAHVHRFSLLTALHIADALVHEMKEDLSLRGNSEPDMDYLRSFNAEARLVEWREITREVLAKEKIVKYGIPA